MIDMLTKLFAQDGEIAAKRDQLKCLDVEELKRLAVSNGLQVERSKEKLIDRLMELEAKFREESRTHGQKFIDALAKKKEELDLKTGPELKDICSAKGLKP